MNRDGRENSRRLYFAVVLAIVGARSAAAERTFISFDPRLPNPDRPYVMTSGTVFYDSPAIAAFEFWATNPSQLDVPNPVPGGYSFDSTFNVAFEAQMSFASEPYHPVSGIGTAHARGFAPGGSEPTVVFDTELLALDLMGTSPIRGSFMLRESPTLSSTGVTRVEGGCYGPVCPAVVLPMRISSFFDVFSEVSIDGGATWSPAHGSFRIEQIPEPATIWLVSNCGVGIWWTVLGRKRSHAAPGAAN